MRRAGVLVLWLAVTLWAGEGRRSVSLTLIPPSPVTDQVVVEVRGALWNRTEAAETFDAAFYLDREEPAALLHREQVAVAKGTAAGTGFRWPTKGRAGRHRVLLVARGGGRTLRMERPIEILASEVRSTRRIGGAWVDIYHHSEAEGRYFNAEMAKMTDADWRELVQAMHAIDMNVLVITAMFQNYTHYGKHRIEQEGYHGKAYYPSRLYPGRMPITSKDPLEAILGEADRLGMHVFPGVGWYAFFDYTPGSLAWHKKVADELWERYGHHPSFYGWYVSEEIGGNLGGTPQRWREIAAFFRDFQAHCRALAPDKPVMLAPNCYGVAYAADAYRKLLPHCDILSPFGFHRMPGGDVSGEEAARLLQSLCDETGAHLWMDLETFVFHRGGALYPRPIRGLASDLRRFPSFEKILCYQFPGLMASAQMSRRPGGEPAVKLYQDYQRYLAEGPPDPAVKHLAVGRPVKLAARYDPRYQGGGPAGLVDGSVAIDDDYRDPAWQGFWRHDLDATIDLGKPTVVASVRATCLQQVTAGIFLPTGVELAASSDGKQFRVLATLTHTVPAREAGPLTKEFAAKVAPAQARYIRVRAKSLGTIPAWHVAKGQKAWLFVDEIVVR